MLGNKTGLKARPRRTFWLNETNTSSLSRRRLSPSTHRECPSLTVSYKTLNVSRGRRGDTLSIIGRVHRAEADFAPRTSPPPPPVEYVAIPKAPLSALSRCVLLNTRINSLFARVQRPSKAFQQS
ncbi:hypothetical protein EVAR_27723_1 [Eumeta japonica]|uniref:Uncharacterized protein n=1 Tax=Eumeta variegata TaxID=151549 RepID=A0A4C1WPJ6_EUMVA|nr:hypothetical protein EVAR_27723_1 [Eumeta japonica]